MPPQRVPPRQARVVEVTPVIALHANALHDSPRGCIRRHRERHDLIEVQFREPDSRSRACSLCRIAPQLIRSQAEASAVRSHQADILSSCFSRKIMKFMEENAEK